MDWNKNLFASLNRFKPVCSKGNNCIGELKGIQTALQHSVEQQNLKDSSDNTCICGLSTCHHLVVPSGIGTQPQIIQ